MIQWIKNLFVPKKQWCELLIGLPYKDSTIYKVIETREYACFFIVTKKDYDAAKSLAKKNGDNLMQLPYQILLPQEAEKMLRKCNKCWKT